MDPSIATSPTQQAPPDRPSVQVEDLCQQLLAAVLGDRVIDMNERKILYQTFQVLSQAAAASGPGGLGAGAPQGDPTAPPQTPGDMNQNTQDQGTIDGAQPENPDEGY